MGTELGDALKETTAPGMSLRGDAQGGAPSRTLQQGAALHLTGTCLVRNPRKKGKERVVGRDRRRQRRGGSAPAGREQAGKI